MIWKGKRALVKSTKETQRNLGFLEILKLVKGNVQRIFPLSVFVCMSVRSTYSCYVTKSSFISFRKSKASLCEWQTTDDQSNKKGKIYFGSSRYLRHVDIHAWREMTGL